MMRTLEVLIVIVIILGAFLAVSNFAVLPASKQVSAQNLRRLSLTTLETLDSNHDLSSAAFDVNNNTRWANLQVALSASLPADVIYNLTIYNVNNAGVVGTQLYTSIKNISNAVGMGSASDASEFTVASSNVTFNVTPQKIGENGGGTLYILNCSDANGWWITGYTSQSLAADLENLLAQYFVNTVLVNSTAQLGQILNGTPLGNETLRNAVLINTAGEAVPIPPAFNVTPYSNDQYAYYNYFLGQKVNQYNWTWASIVGYPFYYVSNTGIFSTDENTYGIYGMEAVQSAGLNSFLRGLNGESYIADTVGWINLGGNGNPSSEQVSISSSAQNFSNYYGIYPYFSQTSTRAVPSTIESRYNLNAATSVFNPVSDGGKIWLAGTVFEHNSNGNVTGKLVPIGLTRSTDIRVTALAILSYYQPRLYASDYTVYGTSRLAVLQLGLAGGS